jgi:3-isopropylmalate/(R)-2-methylmalate dehydratase small subunit
MGPDHDEGARRAHPRKLPTISSGSGPRFVRHAGTAALIRVRDESDDVVAPDRMFESVQGASILLTREPFQSSAPETALARLVSLDVRVVLALGFEPQIYGKCVAAGVLPLPLEEATLEVLVDRVTSRPGDPITVDLERQVIEMSDGEPLPFGVDPRTRTKLLSGLTDLEEVLKHAENAEALRSADRARRPWLYEAP